MRKILILCLCVILYSCQQQRSNDFKAKVLISNYLDSNIYYPGNYFPISYEKLQPFTQASVEPPDEFLLTSEITELKKLNANIQKAADYVTNTTLSDQFAMNTRKIAEIKRIIELKRNGFNSLKDGWFIEHTYLAPNDFGTVIKQTNRFYFNKNLTRIEFVQDQLKKLPTWFLYVPVRYADNK